MESKTPKNGRIKNAQRALMRFLTECNRVSDTNVNDWPMKQVAGMPGLFESWRRPHTFELYASHRNGRLTVTESTYGGAALEASAKLPGASWKGAPMRFVLTTDDGESPNGKVWRRIGGVHGEFEATVHVVAVWLSRRAALSAAESFRFPYEKPFAIQVVDDAGRHLLLSLDGLLGFSPAS